MIPYPSQGCIINSDRFFISDEDFLLVLQRCHDELTPPATGSHVDLTLHDNHCDNEFAMLWKQALDRHSDTSTLTLSCLAKSKSMRSHYAEEYSGEPAIVSG